MAFAILAPSIITLVGASSDKILVMDFTEEENKKEEKKEILEKDFFFYRDFILVLSHNIHLVYKLEFAFGHFFRVRKFIGMGVKLNLRNFEPWCYHMPF